MHHPTDKITHTTAFVTPVVEHWLEREIAQWVHPMKDRSDDPSHHERTHLPWLFVLILNYLVFIELILQLLRSGWDGVSIGHNLVETDDFFKKVVHGVSHLLRHSDMGELEFEMFYLMTHSTHFIYMVSDIW